MTESPVGRIGRVTVTITPPRLGEVVVFIRGGSERYGAACDEVVPLGAQVVVVAEDGARTVTVTPFQTDPVPPQ